MACDRATLTKALRNGPAAEGSAEARYHADRLAGARASAPQRTRFDIVDIVFTARPSAISFEAANPRHGHEWTLFERVKLPDGKTSVPGIIESKSNFIEHPDLVAQRIGRYARLVGCENVVAGSDCGFGTWVGQAAVDPDGLDRGPIELPSPLSAILQEQTSFGHFRIS